MLKVLKVAGSVLLSFIIVFVGVAFYFVKNLDLNKYTKYAEDIVYEATGRKLFVQGKVDLALSFVPTIVINDVKFANAEWAKNEYMAESERFEIKLSLPQLLHKKLLIDKVLLENAKLNLEVSEDGQKNWIMQSTKKTINKTIGAMAVANPDVDINNVNAASSLLAGFMAKHALLENADVVYDNLQTKQKQVVQIEVLKMNQDLQSIKLDLKAIFNGEKISLNATAGALEDVFKADKEYPIALKIRAFGANVQVNANVLDLLGNVAYAANVNLESPLGNYKLPQIQMVSDVSGDLYQSDIQLKKLKLNNNILAGNVFADWQNTLLYVKANLQTDKLDIANLITNKKQAWNILPVANAAMYVPNDKVDYALLKQLNADVVLSAKQIILPNTLELKNVKADASLSNGVLDVKNFATDIAQGTLNANAKVNANNQQIVLDIKANNIQIKDLHKEFIAEGTQDFGILSGGNLKIQTNLITHGQTYRNLIENLDGRFVAIVGETVFQAGSLNFLRFSFLNELLKAINFASVAGDKNWKMSCGVVRADFAKNMAIFPNSIAFSSSDLNLTMDGSINLINDKIDFTVSPSARKIKDTNISQMLSSLVKIEGTITNPKILVNAQGAMNAVVGFMTTGGIYGGSKMLLDRNTSPCYSALEGTGFEKQFPKPNVSQRIYNDTSKEIDKGIELLGNAAKSLFKKLSK